jgi:hypothetical protein
MTFNQWEFGMEKRYSERTMEFYRKKILPEEERETLMKWDGLFRWFKSPNILCIEDYPPNKTNSKNSRDHECAEH